MTADANPIQIERSFARIAEGQVHIRTVAGADLPLLMLHAGPASARGLAPLMHALRGCGCEATLIAPDMLGNGDSAAPTPDVPDIAYYADSLRRVLDTLGIARVNLYGAHTGARIACEFAIQFPERADCVVLDGITTYPPDLQSDILANYAPVMTPRDDGSHLIWAFNFVRDQVFHYPYFRRDLAHRQNNRAVPSADFLHAHVLDVLKGLTTYHKAYNAAFRYAVAERLPLMTQPTLVLEADVETSVLRAAAAQVAGLIPIATRITTTGGVSGKAAAIAAFLAARNTSKSP